MIFLISIQILIEYSVKTLKTLIRRHVVASDLGLHCMHVSNKKDVIGLYNSASGYTGWV